MMDLISRSMMGSFAGEGQLKTVDSAVIGTIAVGAGARVSAVGEELGELIDHCSELEVRVVMDSPEWLVGGAAVSLVSPPLGISIRWQAGHNVPDQSLRAAASVEGAPDIRKIARFQ